MRVSLRITPTMPTYCRHMGETMPGNFGHNKTPLIGGGCNRLSKDVFKRRGFRLGAYCTTACPCAVLGFGVAGTATPAPALRSARRCPRCPMTLS